MEQNQSKICQHCHNKFSITKEELSLYKKVDIELPTICFFCRVKLHLSFWMFGKFRKGKSDLSGESLITVLPKKNRYPIYTLHEWHSDNGKRWIMRQIITQINLFLSNYKNYKRKFLIRIKMVQIIRIVIGVMMFGIQKIAIYLVQWKFVKIYTILIEI